jgi:hypothetical protein
MTAQIHTIAEDAIGLFLEYRDAHGCDEEQARVRALEEVVEGVRSHEQHAGTMLARIQELMDSSPWGPTRAQACRTLFEIRQVLSDV